MPTHTPMIQLTRIHGSGTFTVNADLLETVEATPDTVVTLVTRRRFVVADSVEEIVERVREHHADVAARAALAHGGQPTSGNTMRALDAAERAAGEDDHSSDRKAA